MTHHLGSLLRSRAPTWLGAALLVVSLLFSAAVSEPIRTVQAGPQPLERRSARITHQPPPARTVDELAHDVPAASAPDPLSVYLAHAIYPPSSRPLSYAHRDLIDYNRRHERPRPSRHDPSIEVLYSADRYWLVGEQPLRSWLRVTRAGRPLAVQIHEAWAQLGSDTLLPLEYTRAVDGYANVLRLAQLDLGTRASVLRLSIVFGTAHWRETAALRFVVSPTAGLPARFTGEFDDRIVQGSLHVDVGIAVERAGHFVIDCNLYGPDGQPIAWSRFKGRLERDDSQLSLRFFGKVIRDAGVEGPWSIGQLRGGRYVEGAAADMQMMKPFAGRYQTTAQQLSELSDLPWRSAHKTAKLAKLEQLLATPHAPSVAAATP